ncbi:MAG: chemotaxis protein CheA [Spirochaetota bacterium]
MIKSFSELDNIKQTFFIESREMLDEMERCLLALEKEPGDQESINALFRSVHTIKGSSGMFGYSEIERFSHVVENILDRLRKGVLLIDASLSSVLLEAHDRIQELFDIFESNSDVEIPAEMREKLDASLSLLNSYSSEPVKEKAKKEQQTAKSEESNGGKDYWHISLRFGRNVFRNGLDPYSFINFLNEIGKIVKVRTVADDIPSREEMDPESCYLGFEISFAGDVQKETIEDVFEFVKEDSQIRILPPNSSIEKYVALINELPESSVHLGEMLVSVGSLTKTELEAALNAQKIKAEAGDEAGKALLGDILLEKNMIQKPVLDAVLNKQQDIKKAEKKNQNVLRVNAEKVDMLIKLVGELVIRSSNVKQLSEKSEDSELIDSVLSMTGLIEEIRDNAMNIRMVPIGDTFKRFERVVRDLGKERGKEIDLVITGGDTELDKTLIDKISDPLMHLVRNSIDHGIDMPDERVRNGKPRMGTIYLNAYNEMGSVVIAASDDGNGLDKDRIYEKAVEVGFIQPGEQITENDIFQFIFEPGFSTARQVTNISGRGVGMDVVKRNIESLQGTVALESVKGAGTTVKIHLPLTLAIIDGFMVQVGNQFYVIPQDMVIECIDVAGDKIMVKEGGNFISLRGEILPFMRLRDFFNDHEGKPDKENVIVVEHSKRIAGLVVDRPMGEVQAVIKPLGKIFSQQRWINGATILGNGDVALILDIPKLLQKIENRSFNKTERTGKNNEYCFNN